MKHSILGLISICIFSIFTSVFALSAPENLRIISSDTTSITIDWESVPGAIGYYHYVGTESGVYTDGIDLIDATEFRITDLNPDTSYFITITSVDEFGVESAYASEISYGAWQSLTINSDNFRISDVEVLDATTLQVEFSRELESNLWATREFVIEKKQTGIEVPVALTQVDEADDKMVLVLLWEALQEEQEYDFTVLDIRDKDGNTIESWIDAFTSFTTSKDFSVEDTVNEDQTFGLESAWNTSPNTSSTNGQNSSDPTNNNTANNAGTSIDISSNSSWQEKESWDSSNSVNGWNAGVTLRSEELSNTTSKTAEENNTLPQTWPEHWLLWFLAILLSAGFFYKYRKK